MLFALIWSWLSVKYQLTNCFFAELLTTDSRPLQQFPAFDEWTRLHQFFPIRFMREICLTLIWLIVLWYKHNFLPKTMRVYQVEWFGSLDNLTKEFLIKLALWPFHGRRRRYSSEQNLATDISLSKRSHSHGAGSATCGQTTVDKWAPIRYIISINDMAHWPL